MNNLSALYPTHFTCNVKEDLYNIDKIYKYSAEIISLWGKLSLNIHVASLNTQSPNIVMVIETWQLGISFTLYITQEC